MHAFVLFTFIKNKNVNYNQISPPAINTEFLLPSFRIISMILFYDSCHLSQCKKAYMLSPFNETSLDKPKILTTSWVLLARTTDSEAITFILSATHDERSFLRESRPYLAKSAPVWLSSNRWTSLMRPVANIGSFPLFACFRNQNLSKVKVENCLFM